MGYVNKLRITSVHLGGGSALSIASSVAQSLAGGVFELQINPEQMSRSFKITQNLPPTTGDSGTKSEPQYASVEPEALEVKFTIDGTGVVPIQQPAIDLVTQAFARASDQVGFVTAKLAQLQTVVYGIHDESHRPPFILINWGKLVFFGTLDTMTQTHTLFHESGLPLRVDISLKVVQYKLPSLAASALSLLSPDLTRKRTVKSSDTLLNLCTEIYENPDYYLEVAKVNNLTNFRKLKIGSELILPPIASS